MKDEINGTHSTLDEMRNWHNILIGLLGDEAPCKHKRKDNIKTGLM
jgi:hypothetical protein